MSSISPAPTDCSPNPVPYRRRPAVTISATGMALRCSGTRWPASRRSPTTRMAPQSAIVSQPMARGSNLCIMPPVRIVHADGLAGAAAARGLVVVIDVLRAFTVSAYALAGGATECLLVATVEEAFAVSSRIPGSLLSAEVDGLPIPGIEISNSPTLLLRHDLAGRTLVQRTSAGTQGVAAATGADQLLAASLVV